MRDPKIDPEPGDTLCASSGRAVVAVDSVNGSAVAYRLLVHGRPDAPHVVDMAEWRRLAAAPAVVPIADVIADVEQRRDALDCQLAWLRGVK